MSTQDSKTVAITLKDFNRAVLKFIDTLLGPVAKTSVKGKLYAKEFKSGLSKAVSINQKFIVAEFGSAIAECKNKDEKYFMNLQYGTKLTEISATYDIPYNQTIEAIEMMRKVFAAESSESKKTYFTLLNQLIDMYGKLKF